MDYTLEGEEFFQKTALHVKLLFIPSKANNFRPKFLQSKFLLYFVICLLIIKIVSIVVFINFPKNIFFADITRNTLINLVNQKRSSLGIEPLVESQKLDEAALLKAKDMMEKDYFSHQSPEGVTPWYWFSKIGYSYKYAGENLAIGFLNSEDVYNAWSDSTLHRENMINPNYKEIGTAVLTGDFQGNNTTMIVQLFGSPKTTNIPAVKNIIEEEPVKEVLNENSAISQGEVLSQTSEYPVIKASNRGNSNTLYLRFLNFLFYNSDKILEYTVYFLALLTGAALLLNIVIHFNIQHTDLILRSAIVLVLLALTAVIDKNIITLIIPPKIII